jgi:predicted enzyme related to lactoylglutathione lyase
MSEANSLTRHGKLSYLRIPAVDMEQSAAFYAEIFGWTLRGSPAQRSFTDASEQLIGAFVTHLKISSEPGLLPYIYVQGLDATLARISAKGCSILTPPYPEGDLWVATFRDPAGNVIGLWQMGGR